jgi:CBS domain-containing protein
MVECNVAGIVVIDADGKLEGIVTERDIIRRVVGKKLDPTNTTLAKVMTKNPDTLSPTDTALKAVKMMRDRGYRHLPVVDDGQVVGMVSIRDLYAAVMTELEEDIHETEAFVFGDRYGA